ncbi:MAG: hypothetical protein ABI744_08185 [Chloroflexota bacterium]
MTTRFLFSRWSGFVPVAMSLAALGVLGLALATGANEHSDEGTFTHLWQLLIFGQIPIVGGFVFRWVPIAPPSGLLVLASQLGAALLALMPVYLLHL